MTIHHMCLGPILGLEGNNLYSVIFASSKKLDKNYLKLALSMPSAVEKLSCNHEFKLYSTWVYKFTFSVDPQSDMAEIRYEILASNIPIFDKHSNHHWKFVVPGSSSVPKIGFASCNGNGKVLPKQQPNSDYVMWDLLYQSHSTENLTHAFHCLILGGDQIYADPIWKSIPYFKKHQLLGWRSNKAMINHKIAEEDRANFEADLELFYETLYIESWSKPAIAKTLAAIPSIMMWDDHDIFDGWGSQPPALQNCELFQLIFKIARKYFEVFQIRGHNNVSRISDDNYSLQLRFRNFEIFSLDNRSHRTNHQIMSDRQYHELAKYLKRDLFDDMPEKLQSQKTLLFSIPVPIAHLNYKKRTEGILRFQLKFHFRYSFNDDALDHWDHENHITEQKHLLDFIFNLADITAPTYAHIISGDVHSAGAGRIVKEGDDGTRIVNEFISSPIVYKPIGRFQQFLLSRLSDQYSEVDGYQVSINKLGFGTKPAETIYQRNFAAFYKGQGMGLRVYFTFENEAKHDQPDQPAKYFRTNQQFV